jgi:arylsulfatase A-like enzyme
LTSKLAAYEESIGVPFYASIGGGVSTNAMIISNDWAPTIAQLAGVSSPSTVDGTSFLPLLSNPSQPWRNRYLAEHWEALSGSDEIFDMPDYLAIRTSINNSTEPNQLYVQYETSELEFYYCAVDPYEINNLAVVNEASVLPQLRTAVSFINLLDACVGQACHNAEFQ